jgi:prevent-host-death family protein
MDPVNIFEAKAQFSKLVELFEKGQDVIIARAGKPVARLTRLKPAKTADPLRAAEGEDSCRGRLPCSSSGGCTGRI